MKLNEWIANIPQLPQWEELPDIELYMDQVVNLGNRYLETITGNKITASMVNSYVKKSLIPRPDRKKYSQKHLVSLFIVTILKQAYSLDDIQRWLDKTMKNDFKKFYNHFSKLFNSAFTNLNEEHFDLQFKQDTNSTIELTIDLIIQTVITKLISEHLIRSL